MMKIYEFKAFSPVSSWGVPFSFDIEAESSTEAHAKYAQIISSPEYAARKLVLSYWGTRESRQRAEAIFGKHEDVIAWAHRTPRLKAKGLL